ncbi:MAG: type II secretory pathway component PulK [Myxococcota bacterium]|jgi:type II secretory pathway component PulK
MARAERIWQALTRPRQLPRWARRPRRRTNRRSGIALLVAVTTMLVLSIVVSELAYTAQVRFLIAYHQRDRAQAYWIARSGVNIYSLILVADRQIGNQIAGLGIDLPVSSLWEMVPVLNTGLMRMLFASGGSGPDVDDDVIEDFQQTGQVSAEIAESTRESSGSVFSDRNFLDFEGDFSAEVQDNESKVDINQFAGESGPVPDSTTAQYLYALMSGDESEQWLLERGLERWELIGNLRDWVDVDGTRDAGLGGYEDTLYNSLTPPYLSKNTTFDTIDEIRMVEGWQDDVFAQYGQYLTIYANGKSNPNRWDDRQHAAAIAQMTGLPYEAVITMTCLTPSSNVISLTLLDATFQNKNDYVSQVKSSCGLEEVDGSKLSLNLTNKSQVFTITSTGLVGTSAVTISTVLDFSSSNLGKIRYWRVE